MLILDVESETPGRITGEHMVLATHLFRTCTAEHILLAAHLLRTCTAEHMLLTAHLLRTCTAEHMMLAAHLSKTCTAEHMLLAAHLLRTHGVSSKSFEIVYCRRSTQFLSCSASHTSLSLINISENAKLILLQRPE
jgi:hypothetical protein